MKYTKTILTAGCVVMVALALIWGAARTQLLEHQLSQVSWNGQASADPTPEALRAFESELQSHGWNQEKQTQAILRLVSLEVEESIGSAMRESDDRWISNFRASLARIGFVPRWCMRFLIATEPGLVLQRLKRTARLERGMWAASALRRMNRHPESWSSSDVHVLRNILNGHRATLQGNGLRLMLHSTRNASANSHG